MAQYAGIEIQIIPVTVNNEDKLSFYLVHKSDGALFEQTIAITSGIPNYLDNEFEAGDASSIEVTAQNLWNFLSMHGDYNNYYNVSMLNSNTVFVEANTYDIMSFQPGEEPSWAEFTFIYEEEPEPNPIQIDNVTVTEASSNKQTNVRYEFTVSNANYPFDITTPITKTVNDVNDQWIEYNRFPEPNISDYRAQLTVDDVSGTDSIDLPRVDLIDFNEINTFPTTGNGDVEIVMQLTHTDQNGIRLEGVEFSLNNSDWHSDPNNELIYTFQSITPDDYTVYVRDEYGRKINNTFTLTQLTIPQYNLKFKIEGNKPPFNVELRLESDSSIIETKTVNNSNTNQEFTDISGDTEYCIYVKDDINNTDEECNIIHVTT